MERYRTTLIMVGALIVLGAAALFLSNNHTATTGTPTPMPVVYVWQEANPVNAIDVVSGTGKVSVQKDPTLGTWKITQPVSKPADLFSVGGVADSMQKLQATFSVTSTGDLAQFGLGPTAMTVTVTFSDTAGTKHILNVGKTILDGSGYYVNQSGSNNVFVVANTTIEPLRTWLTTPPVEQPSPTPLPITPVVLTATPTPTFTPAPTQAPPTAPAATPPAGATAALTSVPVGPPSAGGTPTP